MLDTHPSYAHVNSEYPRLVSCADFVPHYHITAISHPAITKILGRIAGSSQGRDRVVGGGGYGGSPPIKRAVNLTISVEYAASRSVGSDERRYTRRTASQVVRRAPAVELPASARRDYYDRLRSNDPRTAIVTSVRSTAAAHLPKGDHMTQRCRSNHFQHAECSACPATRA